MNVTERPTCMDPKCDRVDPHWPTEHEVKDLSSLNVGKVRADDLEPRPFDIADVPRTISREDWKRTLAMLGLKSLQNVTGLSFGYDCIKIEMNAMNAEGHPFFDGEGVAKHHITIPVVD